MFSNNLTIIMIFTLLIMFCVVDEMLLHRVPGVLNILNLSKGSICGKGEGLYMNFTCKHANDCDILPESIQSNNYLDICSFEGRVPIVCCPPTPDTMQNVSIITGPTIEKVQNSSVAFQKCQQYNALKFRKSRMLLTPSIFGESPNSHEFPHMAILGYGNATENKREWKCGGSLISNRWILSAAHCHQSNSRVQWARLGDLNIDTMYDDARPNDYQIMQHVIYPDYDPSKKYNDIALFLLEKDVEFSLEVRPVCLNSDPSHNPTELTATGWHVIPQSKPKTKLLVSTLNIVPTNECNDTYFSEYNKESQHEIVHDSMICGVIPFEDTACMDDFGGQIQLKNEDNSMTYTQFGIQSFGPGFCGQSHKPSVYTKVSKYIKWIERIVWSDS